ncbi:hypothetical protein EGW08_005014 [Elysia chlorotica]|uniref:Uncharacterized protein n=1 Tax=Elysia chlorotica TaxID=188477 RepID=A0A3S0ZUQ4_ELYCH|nr:hypothetical protein EGW08_005014 [Elysia chlorotica]
MAFLHSALHISSVLAVLCSVVLSQAPPTDPALFANLFMSSPQAGGASSNMINPGPSATDLSALVGGSQPFASSASGGSLPPDPMFPTLGGSPLGSMPPASAPKPAPNPMSQIMNMMLFRKMDMGNIWPLFAFSGMGAGAGGGSGGMFSNPLVMYSMFNNMM